MAQVRSTSKHFLFFAIAGISLVGIFGFSYLPVTDDKSPNLNQGELHKRDVFTISDNVRLVLLNVNVSDSKGGFVSGLQKDNFSVSEDGQPRDIAQFDSVDEPVSVGLVVDNSGSMAAKKPEVVMAGLSFAHESNRQDEFFVVNFNDSVVRGLPRDVMFTDNLQELRAALFYGRPAGRTALYDAIAYSLRHLEFGHLEKRTLIVVSDGGDNVSKISFPELMEMVEASRATIYTVGLYEQGDRDMNPGVLRKIAAVTGGEFFQPENLNDILPVFKKIAQEIRNSYTIAYVPNETTDHRAVRTVHVSVRDGNRHLVAHTRTKYLVKPFEEMSAEINMKHEENRH